MKITVVRTGGAVSNVNVVEAGEIIASEPATNEAEIKRMVSLFRRSLGGVENQDNRILLDGKKVRPLPGVREAAAAAAPK